MSAVTSTARPKGYDALLLAKRRVEHRGAILHVNRDDTRMARLAEALAFFAPEVEVLRFPAWDCLPYDRVSPNPAIVSERIACLARLLEQTDRPRIVLTTVNALVQRVPPRGVFRGASLSVRAGGSIEPDQLTRFLEANGYGRADTVMEPGEYACAAASWTSSRPASWTRCGSTCSATRSRASASSTPPPSAPPTRSSGWSCAPCQRGLARPGEHQPLPRGMARAVRPAGGAGPDLRQHLGRAAAPGHGALGAAVPYRDGEPGRLPAGRGGELRRPDATTCWRPGWR